MPQRPLTTGSHATIRTPDTNTPNFATFTRNRQVYAAIFIDAIVVKIRDGQVANRPVYAAIGVTLDGEKDILGLWAGTGGEGAKFWMSVLTDIRNRGVKDSFFLVCDGLKACPRSSGACGR
jgi:transposase-like protein